MKAGLLVRVSDEDQVDGYSLDQQEVEGRAFCASRGWKVVAVYKAEGESGKTFERTDIQEAFADAEAGKINVIVAHKIDRFSRATILDALQTLEAFQKLGVSFASVKEPFDFTGPFGQLMLIMFLFFARNFLVNLADEVSKGRKGRYRAGKSNSRRPPYPYVRKYTTDPTTGKVIDSEDVIDETKRDFGLLIFEKASQGYAALSIAKWLNSEGQTTPDGKPFSKAVIREMLRNKFFCGYVSYRGLRGKVDQAATPPR